MTTEEALEFLRAHQPLPPDRNLSQEVIDTYDEVRRHFTAKPDRRALPLFLQSFGDGNGFGVYQLVEDVFAQAPPDEAADALAKGLSSQRSSVRYWSAQIAAATPSPALAEPLLALVADESSDVRFAAISALELLNPPDLKARLRPAYDAERDSEVRELLEELLFS